MRLLLVGAFPYPHHQGSQVYFQEQARALRGAGAEVELLTYASGLSADVLADTGREIDDFIHHTPPAWTAPRGMRSGLSWGKPLADLALAMTLRQRLASRSGSDAYDAILTHNAEAALVALIALRGHAVPHVYCPHTLLGQELSAYVSIWKIKGLSRSSDRAPRSRRLLDRIGRSIDRLLARRVDGWIALTQSSYRVMRQFSTAPGERIAPPVPDPRPRLGRDEVSATAKRHGLEPDAFFLYSGNLDGYQELEVLATAALLLGEAFPDPAERPVLVVACHDAENEARVSEIEGVEFRWVRSAAEMQALLAAARASLLMRQARGGFPIKLANALAVGTPTIAFHAGEWGLRDGQDALVASLDRPGAGLAGSILRLASDDDLLLRLRSGARALYEANHQPGEAARRSLALIEEIRSAVSRDPRSGPARSQPHGR